MVTFPCQFRELDWRADSHARLDQR